MAPANNNNARRDDTYYLGCCHVKCLCLWIAGLYSALHLLDINFAILYGIWPRFFLCIVNLICYVSVVVGIYAKQHYFVIPAIVINFIYCCKYVLEIAFGFWLLLKNNDERLSAVAYWAKRDTELYMLNDVSPKWIPLWLLLLVSFKMVFLCLWQMLLILTVEYFKEKKQGLKHVNVTVDITRVNKNQEQRSQAKPTKASHISKI
ncbi:hypothetical protein Ddc_09115 [Ditylenchus destructor]|nr:hypothetical protein Ddc_09115 [Ditylenchus destructor]